jgi:hypothetical protein
MSRQSEHVKKWRQRFKQRVIDSMGGNCQICGYDKCNSALELHHIDPSKKELSFGSLLAHPKSWKESVVPELKKCILLCSCCHREVHAEVTNMPESFAKFDEEYSDYMSSNDFTSPCPHCGEQKSNAQRYCSYSCSTSASKKIDWDSINLSELIDSGKTYLQISEDLGCSIGAVSKRAKKLGFAARQKLIVWPSSEELQALVWMKPLLHLAKDLGVSDKGLKKRCLKFKIKTPPAGHWNSNPY